jgi:hypothetical protein
MRLSTLALGLFIAGCGGSDASDTDTTATDNSTGDTDGQTSNDTDDMSSSGDTDTDDTSSSGDTDPSDSDSADTDAADTDAADTDAADTDAADTDAPDTGGTPAAVQFEGNADQSYWALNPIELPEASRSWTFDFWVYVTALPLAEIRLLDWRTGGTSTGYVAIDLTTGGRVQLESLALAGPGSFYTADGVSTNTLTLSEWNHVAVTIDGTTQSVAILVNGSATSVSPGPDWWTTPLGGTHNLAMGGTATMPLQGRLDNVRAWNKALTTSEVAEVRDEVYTVATAPATLIDQWDFNTNLTSLRGNEPGEAKLVTRVFPGKN